jgi:polyhydroxyalkanoate synthesis regulator phasin
MSDEAEIKTEAETDDQAKGESKGITGQAVRDLIERTFLAGMGAAALTKDRVQELVEDLVHRGQLNSDEGRETVERLVSRSREEARSVLKRADSSLQGAYRDLGLTSKHELEELDFRLRQLEHRVGLLEATADMPSEEKAED